jgi:hypothetical protein
MMENVWDEGQARCGAHVPVRYRWRRSERAPVADLLTSERWMGLGEKEHTGLRRRILKTE